ncbi:MAG TPA: transglutaminase-like domain-containing protein [Kofleriaceae bacterium]|nr:transglutaminase-like domain-containing protein [Kofleriaceae bacterium]
MSTGAPRPIAAILVVLVGLIGACGSSARAPAAGLAPQPAEARAPIVDPSVSEGSPLLTVAQVEALLPDLAIEQWFGVYLGDNKVGYGHATVRRTADGEPGGVLVQIIANLEVGGLGTDKAEILIQTESYYSGEPPFPLVEQRTLERSPDGQVEKRFVASPGRIVLHERVDGAPRPERTLAPSREGLPTMLASIITVPATLRAGQTVTYYSFDDETETDALTRQTVVEITRRRISGVDTQVVVLQDQKIGEQGVSTTVLAGDGGMLEATIGGMKLRLEDEAIARSDVAGFDIFRDAVELVGGGTLGDPDRVTRLRLILGGVPEGFSLPTGPNQQVSRRPDGRVEVVIASVPGPRATDAEKREALVITAAIDAGHPAIIELASQLTSGQDTDGARVEALRRWVYEKLAKKLSSNISIASQVLERRIGDCTEHALLFTAMARSQGIPARRIAGVTYMGDEYGRFGWHEWTEVVIDGHWVQIDPSWGPPVANATHLNLGLSERNDSSMLMGVLTISLPEVGAK